MSNSCHANRLNRLEKQVENQLAVRLNIRGLQGGGQKMTVMQVDSKKTNNDNKSAVYADFSEAGMRLH